MKSIMLSLVIITLWATPARPVELEVAVTVHRLNAGGFVEFKAESDQRGEKATGHIRTLGRTFVYKWQMGSAKQNIWYWWDNLDGMADLKIVVRGAPGTPVTLWEAPCEHRGRGEQQVGRTLGMPYKDLVPGLHHYRRHPGLSPYLVENKQGANTHIKDCDSVQRPGRGCNEWDIVCD